MALSVQACRTMSLQSKPERFSDVRHYLVSSFRLCVRDPEAREVMANLAAAGFGPPARMTLLRGSEKYSGRIGVLRACSLSMDRSGLKFRVYAYLASS